ncbi:uncharacterized protein LOC119429244, partial [Nematolebias whitei]|uniref:uncharacterized protein LOC119429244 n=1 Tax=Nematolebias whitei TaxID=451745 RepID=UPI00189AFCD6
FKRPSKTDSWISFGPASQTAVCRRCVRVCGRACNGRVGPRVLSVYRVIKNQPPPILSIELDHNPFKCQAPGCPKSFRKASLLHYHTKYYHSDQQLDRGLEAGPQRRRRSSSDGNDFMLGRKPESRSSSCHGDDGEQSIMGAELKKEERKEKQGGNDRKDRKHFLRVKLKKKKKKKKKKKSLPGFGSSEEEISDRPPITLKLSHTHVDEGSDWSTLTAESGEDTPPWHVAMETDECEEVRCVCEVDEENDFMIQCESCLFWQHGTCMGLYEDNVPLSYTCYYCRQSSGWRRAQRFFSEPDLLISGPMFGLSCVKENYSETNASKISHTGRLLTHTRGLGQVLNGLQLKISLLRSPCHPDLQLWRLPWRQEDGPRLTSSPRGEPAICYISSEHCYQKPGASWEMAERTQERPAVLVKQEVDSEEKVETGSGSALLHRWKPLSSGTQREMEFSHGREDGLVRTVLSPTEMLEFFEGREDFLYYRHSSFSQAEPSERSEDVSVGLVLERFHRNPSKPANEDVAERLFLTRQGQIELTYHLTERHFFPSKILFTKLSKKYSFTPDMVSTFQADVSERAPQALTLLRLLHAMLKKQNELTFLICKSMKEKTTMAALREQEEPQLKLLTPNVCSSGPPQQETFQMNRDALQLKLRQDTAVPPHLSPT